LAYCRDLAAFLFLDLDFTEMDLRPLIILNLPSIARPVPSKIFIFFLAPLPHLPSDQGVDGILSSGVET